MPAAENHSRAVEYAIDESAHTVRQVWEFVHPEQLYSPFVGSAYELPATGNVLVTFGGLCTVDGVHSDDIAHCRGTARLVEVHHATPDAPVFDLEVSDPDPTAPIASRRSRRERRDVSRPRPRAGSPRRARAASRGACRSGCGSRARSLCR